MELEFAPRFDAPAWKFSYKYIDRDIDRDDCRGGKLISIKIGGFCEAQKNIIEKLFAGFWGEERDHMEQPFLCQGYYILKKLLPQTRSFSISCWYRNWTSLNRRKAINILIGTHGNVDNETQFKRNHSPESIIATRFLVNCSTRLPNLILPNAIQRFFRFLSVHKWERAFHWNLKWKLNEKVIVGFTKSIWGKNQTNAMLKNIRFFG